MAAEHKEGAEDLPNLGPRKARDVSHPNQTPGE
jgi:hypothetical protein